MISLRFHLYPETFKASFLHPTESLFVPASVVSFGTILINISQYGLHKTGPWLNTTVCVFFWIDVALAFVASFGIYLLMSEAPPAWPKPPLISIRWSTQTHTIQQMTPIWIFPAYPLLIIGPHAGILSSQLRQSRALDIIIGGFTAQGIGFMVSLMIYSAYLARLMTRKLPQESLRPGMFVSIGPCGFTVSGIINMAANAQRALPEDFMGDGRTAAMILKVVGNFMSIWLWGYVAASMIMLFPSADIFQSRHLVLVRFCRRTFVVVDPQKNALRYDMVLLRISEYSACDGDVRYWESVRLKGHPSGRLRPDSHSHHRLDLCLRHDDSSYCLEADIMAAKGRRQG